MVLKLYPMLLRHTVKHALRLRDDFGTDSVAWQNGYLIVHLYDYLLIAEYNGGIWFLLLER